MTLRLTLEEAQALGIKVPSAASKPRAGSVAASRRASGATPVPPGTAKPSRARSRDKREREGDEQVLLIQQVRQQFPLLGELLIHIPNGGSRKNAFEGWRLKQQGVRAGVSDLFLPVARGGFHGLWIEFKAAPPFDSPVSDAQREWVSAMRAQGYEATVCLGVDQALAVITHYLAHP